MDEWREGIKKLKLSTYTKKGIEQESGKLIEGDKRLRTGYDNRLKFWRQMKYKKNDEGWSKYMRG